tara:strand:- start:108 stop:575 length:468 start_codon:yes stop_codon:yes gene_type:complete
MKNLTYLLIFIFLSSCGYTSIYQIDQKLNIKLDEIKYSGDKKINRQIATGLKKYEDNNTNNIFDLIINSDKKESIVTKDKKGNATSYKLTLSVNLDLKSNSSSKTFAKKFIKDMSFNSRSNKFELNQYRRELEKNMVSQILQDIDIFLRNIKNDL